MSTDKTMQRGIQQALYKYLPNSWVSFTKSGGGISYAVHIDSWNSIQLTGINNKRLLRVVAQQIKEYKNLSADGERSVVGFPSVIDESTVDVLTPKVSDHIAAIQTSVNPWVFVCGKCNRVKQYYSYDDFKRHEFDKCECGHHMNQLAVIRFCKCGYAKGLFVPKCSIKDHGTKYILRKGSGWDFVCSKCGKPIAIPYGCPDCRKKLEIKSANDSSHYLPFTVMLIDLLDKKKDVFLDNEKNGRGEKVVISRYLNLISTDEYDKILTNGKVTEDDEQEENLREEEQRFLSLGLDPITVKTIIDAERLNNPGAKIFNAIDTVGRSINVSAIDDWKPLAEEILEYDELINAKVVLTLEEAEKDAELINDGIRPEYRRTAERFGFSNAQMCSGVPMVFSAYGFTRKERGGEGVILHGFPQEMSKKNIYATKLETEGVLFELDRKKVIDWLHRNELINENDLPQKTDELSLKTWFLDKVNINLITPFSEINDNATNGRITKRIYTLLHSISHALISEAAEICGLDKSSLSEYILPNIPAVFIYCSNSQGFNMGALYSAFQTYFDKWLCHANEKSRKCIFDPVCISKDKACAGCLFLNEISCQHFNKDLDRSFLCGYFDGVSSKKLKGFWE